MTDLLTRPMPPTSQPLDMATHRALAIAFGSHARQHDALLAVAYRFMAEDLAVTGVSWTRAGHGKLVHGEQRGLRYGYRLHDDAGEGDLGVLCVYRNRPFSEGERARLEHVIGIATVCLSAAAAPDSGIRAHPPAGECCVLAVRIDHFDDIFERGGLDASRAAVQRVCKCIETLCADDLSPDALRIAADGLIEIDLPADGRRALHIAEQLRTVMAAQPVLARVAPVTVSVLVGVSPSQRSALRERRNEVIDAGSA